MERILCPTIEGTSRFILLELARAWEFFFCARSLNSYECFTGNTSHEKLVTSRFRLARKKKLFGHF